MDLNRPEFAGNAVAKDNSETPSNTPHGTVPKLPEAEADHLEVVRASFPCSDFSPFLFAILIIGHRVLMSELPTCLNLHYIFSYIHPSTGSIIHDK